MRAVRFISLIALVLAVEIVLSAIFSFRAVNLAEYPYRRDERGAAFKAVADDRSPENEAAYQEELRLVSSHVTRVQLGRAGVIFLAFLVVDGIIIYTRYGRERASFPTKAARLCEKS